MQYITPDDVQRFTGSLDANWRPLHWMQNEGTVGVDLAAVDIFHVCRLNECPTAGATARVGNVTDNQTNSATSRRSSRAPRRGKRAAG